MFSQSENSGKRSRHALQSISVDSLKRALIRMLFACYQIVPVNDPPSLSGPALVSVQRRLHPTSCLPSSLLAALVTDRARARVCMHVSARLRTFVGA